MKFAICQELFEDMPWDEQCRLIADIGYTGIEVAPFAISDDMTHVAESQLKSMRQTAEQHGLQIIGLHWLLAKTSGLHLTTPDAAVRTRTAEYLKLLADACQVLGGHVLVFGSPQQRSLPAGVTRDQGLQFAAEVFRAAMPVFAEKNVVLCMEPLTSKETDFINTCAEAVELMTLVDHPSFILHQDVKAMLGAEADSIPELIHRHKNVCGHFHVNDTNLLGPGMGETDYHPILRALREVGYRGWVSVEVFDYSPGAEKIARDSLSYLQRVLTDLDD
ncbi:MAG: sugar phosphate isomerase/epimerase family protein [Planctomycetaceae bacterium]